MHASVPAFSDAAVDTCLLLRTGHDNGLARFNRRLHHLHLTQNELPAEKIDLGFSGSRLLARLLSSPGEVVSREELIACGWPERVVGQGSLNQQIYTLRQILGDERNREIIQTLPRRGYLFNPASVLIDETASAPALASEPAPATPESIAAAPPAVAPAPGKSWLWTIRLSVALLLAVTAYFAVARSSTANPNFKVGKLDILLIEADARERQRLIHSMQPVLERMEQLARKPQQLVLGYASDYYSLHCIQGPNSRSLVAHKSQLTQLSDSQLSECLQ